MTRSPTTQVTGRALLLILCVGVLNTLAEVAFKRGVMASGMPEIGWTSFLPFLWSLRASSGIWIGLFCYLVMFLLWMTVLSHMELSVAFPLHSLDYLLVPLCSIVMLHEHVAPLRWVGICLIAAGVLCVSTSSGRRSHDA